jgi:aminoglycoside phosphotransferase
VPRLVLAGLRERWRIRTDIRTANALLSQLGREDKAQAGWRIQTIEHPYWVPTGVTVLMVGPALGPPERAIKLPHTNEGRASLERQQEVQAALHRDERLATWNMLVPRPIGLGCVKGRAYFLESVVPGRVALSSSTDRGEFPSMQAAAVSTISHLHRRTAERVRVDASILDRWVDRRLRVLAPVQFPPGKEGAMAEALDSLRNRLHSALEGQTLQVSWIHGDYWLGNVLVGDDRVTPTGIIDWDRAGPGELPWHDLFHMLLFTRKYLGGGGVSEIVALLSGEDLWNPDERAIFATARAMLPDDGIDQSIMLLLYWLRHTAATLTLYPNYAWDPAYVSANVSPILSGIF